MIPTVRKEIEDWWIEAYLELKHGTVVKIQSALRKYAADIPVGLNPQLLKGKLDSIVSPEDASTIDDVTILGQVKAWSFGEVSQTVLNDEISENKRQAILAVLNGLYSPLPVSGSGN
jgi:hypothetical protein